MFSFSRAAAAFGLAASLAASLAAPLAAQDSRTLILQANGGALHGLEDLDRNAVWSTRTGFSVAGSLGYGVSERVVFRLDANYSRTPVRFFGADAGFNFDRLFTSLIAQIQFPGGSGLNPYLMTGGGLSFINQHATADPKKTVGHWLGGAGLAYRIGQSGLSILAEGRIYLYQPTGLIGGASENRFLADATFGAGLSYALSLR